MVEWVVLMLILRNRSLAPMPENGTSTHEAPQPSVNGKKATRLIIGRNAACLSNNYVNVTHFDLS